MFFLPDGGRLAELVNPLVELLRLADGGAAVKELFEDTRAPLRARRPEAWDGKAASWPIADIPISVKELLDPALESGRLLVGVDAALALLRPLRTVGSFAVPPIDRSSGIATFMFATQGGKAMWT